RMRRVANDDERLLLERDDFKAVMAHRAGNQTEIDRVSKHLLVDLVRVGIANPHIDRGEPLHEGLEIWRQHVQTDAINGGDVKPARDARLCLLDLGPERIISFENSLAGLVKDVSLAGKLRVPFAALDEARGELALECGDGLTHGGLGYPVDLGGPGETLGFSQVTKSFHAVNLHELMRSNSQQCVNAAFRRPPPWPVTGAPKLIPWLASG